MPPPPSDRQLRRLIAQVAAAAPADVEDILDRLDAGSRDGARRLLASYLGVADAQPAPGVSPWLARRLGHEPRRGRDPDAVEAFVMTPHAVSALKAAASARFDDLPPPRQAGGKR